MSTSLIESTITDTFDSVGRILQHGVGWIEAWMSSMPWMSVAMWGAVLMFALEVWLDYRQTKKVRRGLRSDFPKSLYVDTDMLTRLQEWTSQRLTFQRLEGTIQLIFELFFVWNGGLVKLWEATLPLLELVGYGDKHRIMRGLLYIVTVSLLGAAVRTPFEVYRVLYIDKRVASVDAWLSDQLTMFLVSLVLGLPLVGGLLVLLEWDFPYQWVYTCAFTSLVSVFLSDLYPNLLAPLFNTFSVLDNDELRQRIHELAEELRFSLQEVYTIDGTRGTSHSNAFLMGFGNNRSKSLVLYDTLFEKLSTEEILAVIGHELGHHKYNHTLRMLMIQSFSIGQFIFLVSRVLNLPAFYESFGFSDTDPAVGLVIFAYLYSPLANIFHVFTNLLSRHFEYVADEYAVRNGLWEIDTALIRIHASNLTNLVTDKLFSVYHYSHPSLIERLDHIETVRQRMLRAKEREVPQSQNVVAATAAAAVQTASGVSSLKQKAE